MRYQVVMKFGGADLSTPEYIDKTTDIVIANKGKNPIVVPSAIGSCNEYPIKTTDLLLCIADVRRPGNERGEYLKTVISRHSRIISDLRLNDTLLGGDFSEMEECFKHPTEYSPKEYADLLAAFGELMSSKIVAAVQNGKGYPSFPLDAAEIGLITTSRFGNADIIDDGYKEIRKNLFALQGNEKCPVVTGFIGRDKEGRRTTLGRGGSDYTAVVLGAAAKADVELWKSGGFLAAPPDFVKNPVLVDRLSYDEAEELGRYGAKVLQGKTISAAKKHSGIKIHIKDIENPKGSGTLITSGKGKRGIVKGVTCDTVDVLRTYPRTFEDVSTIAEMLTEMDVEVLASSYTSGSPGYALFVVRDSEHSTGNIIRKKTGIDIGAERSKYIVKLVGDGVSENHGIKERFHGVLDKVEGDYRRKNEVKGNLVFRIYIANKSSFGTVVRKRIGKSVIEAFYDEFFSNDAGIG